MVGLLHNSQMGPLAGTIEVGAAIETRVLKIDLEQVKISLTSKPVTVDAWAQLQTQFKVGSRLDGKIKKLAEVGAFVEIMTGISGLVFQADFKHAFPDSATAPAIGDTISVTIRNIDIERRRIALRLNRP
jgi:small subunit ribosomal protein S1